MAADLNGDGNFDGYDMQYLGGGYYGGGDGGCDGCIKYGCLIPLLALVVSSIALTILLNILIAAGGGW